VENNNIGKVWRNCEKNNVKKNVEKNIVGKMWKTITPWESVEKL
jgi:hypothetical protein